MNPVSLPSQQFCRVALRSLAKFLKFGLLAAMAIPGHARSLSEIEKTKELRICIAPIHASQASVEPATCKGVCKFSGPVFEASAAFARSLGKNWRVKFIRVDWDEQFFNKDGKTVREATYTPELLASGKCDFYPSSMTKNPWRSNKLDIVVLFPSRMMVIASRSMQAQIKTLSDLAGKAAAIEKDTSWHTWLQTQNQVAWSSNPVKLTLLSTAESFAAVETSAVDFTLADSDMAIWAVRHQLKTAKLVFPVGPTDEIGWAFRKEDKDLQAAARLFFEQQRKNPDSELNQIWKHHFGRNLTEFITLMTLVK